VTATTLDGAPPQALEFLFRALTGAPWDRDGTSRMKAMTVDQVQSALSAVPAGVIVRQGTSIFAPPAIPDLIGIRDRKYLDKTGLVAIAASPTSCAMRR
jgi:hypothetical protein